MLVDNSVWTYNDLCPKQVRWGRVGTNLNELSWSIGQWFVFLQGIMAFRFHSFDAFGKQLLVEFGRFKQWKHLYLPWNKWMAGIRSFPLGANGLSSERFLLVFGGVYVYESTEWRPWKEYWFKPELSFSNLLHFGGSAYSQTAGTY